MLNMTVIVILVLMAASSLASAQATGSITATNTLSTFPLTSNPTPSQTLTIRTTWNITYNQVDINSCVYMNAPMTGTAPNTDQIAASSVRVNGASIVGTGTNCGIAGARLIFQTRAKHPWDTPNFADVTLTIDILNYPANLAPDTYRGTINLTSIAF